VRFYQIWHEPNIAPHWGNQHIAPTEYAQLLIEASRAIRSVDDDAVIIAGALAPTTDRGHTAIDEVFFLQRMYAAGVKPHVDMIGD
jgi:arabinogalactan endo-1,4-beta-galactosidase